MLAMGDIAPVNRIG